MTALFSIFWPAEKKTGNVDPWCHLTCTAPPDTMGPQGLRGSADLEAMSAAWVVAGVAAALLGRGIELPLAGLGFINTQLALGVDSVDKGLPLLGRTSFVAVVDPPVVCPAVNPASCIDNNPGGQDSLVLRAVPVALVIKALVCSLILLCLARERWNALRHLDFEGKKNL